MAFFSLTYWGPGKRELNNESLSAPFWPTFKLKDILYEDIQRVTQESGDSIRIVVADKKQLLIKSSWFESKEDYLEFQELIQGKLG